MRVWVTRTEPDRTVEFLLVLKHDPIISPVLAVRRIDAQIDLTGVDAIAFTSQNAISAFAAMTKEGRSLPVFAVGTGTNLSAQFAGFRSVRSSDGDVTALADFMAAAKPGCVLHPSSREPAGDLAALLSARGVSARTLPVYETVPVEPVEALAELRSIDAVLVHSPKAARRLVELVSPSVAHPLFACISEGAAKPLIDAGHEKVRWAPFPNEASLLKLLSE